MHPLGGWLRGSSARSSQRPRRATTQEEERTRWGLGSGVAAHSGVPDWPRGESRAVGTASSVAPMGSSGVRMPATVRAKENLSRVFF